MSITGYKRTMAKAQPTHESMHKKTPWNTCRHLADYTSSKASAMPQLYLRSPLVLPRHSPQECPVLLRYARALKAHKFLHFLHFLLAIGHGSVGHCRLDGLLCNSAIFASPSLQPHLTVVSLRDSVGGCVCVCARPALHTCAG